MSGEDGAAGHATQRTSVASLGCLGPIVAGLLSVKTWGLTWWLVLHVPLGWMYVAYWIIFLSGWLK